MIKAFLRRQNVKKALLLAVVLLGVFLLGCADGKKDVQPPPTKESAERAIAGLVEDFGGRLQQVSLLAPKDIVEKSMREQYGDLVTPTLLAEWVENPSQAPGRVTSSPWPERIEVVGMTKQSEQAYEVQGDIIEVTSVEKANGGVAAQRPVSIRVKKIENRWLITAVECGAYEETGATVYENPQYGFVFTLPESWKGYTIVTDQWDGLAIGGSQTVERGPLISIRHPQWTAQNPRQDIPIMVLTLSQWDALQREEFHIGAAPIRPKRLGCNSRYVFALPARYNYAFPIGYEEVEDILESNPLQTNENCSENND